MIAMQDQSVAYQEMRDLSLNCSGDELLALADAWGSVVADKQSFDEVARMLFGDRLRAVRDELERRERVSRANSGVASPADQKYEQWRELARLVRERANILYVLDAGGWHYIHKRGAKEAHAPCPLCGGTDRLVITIGPPGWVWCRQCKVGGDVIAVARWLNRQFGFRDAVKWLAELGGEKVAA